MVVATTRVKLSESLLQRIREREVSGEGGFQELVRKLQKDCIKEDGYLELPSDLRQRVEHYAYAYGSGGWQNLLRELVAEIDQSEQRV